MIEETFRELVHEEIDGTTTPKESARLREHLAAHPEARAYYQEAERLSRILGTVEMIEPPPGLKEAVLRAVMPPARLAASPREAWWAPWIRPLQMRSGLRPLYAFAGGAAVASVVFALVSGMPPGTLDPAAVTGTLLKDTASSAEVEIDRLAIDAAGVTGSATMRSGGGAIVADIHLRSPGGVEVVLGFDPAAFAGIAFAQGRPGELPARANPENDLRASREAAPGALEAAQEVLGGGELRFWHEGERRYVLRLGQRTGAQTQSPPLRLRLYTDGRLVVDRTLDTVRSDY